MRGIVFAGAMTAGLLLMAAGASAQTAPPQSAQENVRQSQQYEALLCSNPAFRAKRIQQECGPLQGSQFYDSCMASFQCNRGPQATRWRQAPPSETIR